MNRAMLLSAGALLLPTLALAETAASGATAGLDPVPPGVHVIKDEEAPTPLVPRAKDLLSSHLLVGASMGPVWSLGRLDSNTTALRGLGTGLGFQGDIGFGLSRSVSVGAFGTYASFSDGNDCTDCSGRAFAVGPFVRYHLSQGLRFDPWLTAGVAYRQLSFLDDTRAAKQKYAGIEWLRLELGADYYVFSGFGIGPYGAIALSSYSTRPTGAGEARVNTELSAGLRLLLDLPGR